LGRTSFQVAEGVCSGPALIDDAAVMCGFTVKVVGADIDGVGPGPDAAERTTVVDDVALSGVPESVNVARPMATTRTAATAGPASSARRRQAGFRPPSGLFPSG
jgi:hypothetical protein